MSSKKGNKSRILFRYMLIIAGLLLFTGRIIVKEVKNTIIDAPHWNAKADSIMSVVDTVAPMRGNILAANGNILSTNVRLYNVRIDFRPRNFKHELFAKKIDSLSTILADRFPDRTKKQYSDLLTKENNRPAGQSRQVLLLSGITDSEVKSLYKLPYFKEKKVTKGLVPEKVEKRIKPFGSMASRSIGTMYETKPGVWHGRSGLESSLDSLLFGKPGLTQKFVLTKRIGDIEKVKSIPGYDVCTTIDIDIQDILEEKLLEMCYTAEPMWATAIIMEVESGEIKAISNFDRSDSGVYTEDVNHAVVGVEPGSVVKALTMVIGMNTGAVKPGDTCRIYDTRPYNYIGRNINDGGHGANEMPLWRFMASSSNVGMSKVGRWACKENPEKYLEEIKKTGFLDRFNLGIAGERVPRVAPLPNNDGGRLTMSRVAFGYGIEIPPVYTLGLYNAIANKGKFVCPRLVKHLERDGKVEYVYPVKYIREQMCSPEAAQSIAFMLHKVVWGEHGTARVLRSDKVDIAGKTGTCFQTSAGGYGSARRFAFCGFFPYKNPKYTCMVLMANCRNGGSAGRTSGTVLLNIAEELYSRGMLGDVSQFPKGPEKNSVVITRGNGKKAKAVCNSFNIKTGELKGEDVDKKYTHIPNVIGMGARDAIHVLERSGVNVGIRGKGIVVGQSIPMGTKITPHSKIILTLR